MRILLSDEAIFTLENEATNFSTTKPDVTVYDVRGRKIRVYEDLLSGDGDLYVDEKDWDFIQANFGIED